MAITALRITDFRNLAQVNLVPATLGLNVIYGQNGSGKTSLLEAIYYLGHGRSFRSSVSAQLIRHQNSKFSLYSQLVSKDKCLLPLGMERHTNGSTQMRLSESDASNIAQFAELLPIRVINSQSHQLFEAGPAYRRKFLDWGLFYHYEQFLTVWRHFERTLKQRNSLLKQQRSSNELFSWSEELAKHAYNLHELRQNYVQILTPILATLTQELLGFSDLHVSYHPGWNDAEDYLDVLTQNTSDEYRLGSTQYGPHRADLDITIDGIAAKHFLSRGQQKMLICGMILAQGIALERHVNKHLIYLIDDLPAELDEENRQKLIAQLIKQQTQVFITAIGQADIYDSISKELHLPMKVFHVEHGNIKEIRYTEPLGVL